MRKVKKTNKNLLFKVSKYLPVFIILLSLTIILGSTFAYFTDKVERTSDLTFSKVELSSETTTGINGTIKDVIPGTPLVNGALKFSKSIDSEAIYVRAKISFTLPNEYKDDNDMKNMVDLLRTATDFNIVSEAQNGAVWSAKSGNYFYLVNSTDTTKLMRVDTIDTYTLSNEIVVPRDLKNLPDNAQYMKSINFHVAFEAIQADNVSNVLSETKEVFNTLFPESESEKSTIKVTFKGFDGISNLKVEEVEKGYILNEPVVDIPLDVNNEPMYVLDGWYTDSEFTDKYEFGNAVEDGITLYPLVYEVSQGLQFTEIKENGEIVGYNVNNVSCTDNFIVIPNTYKGKPITKITSGFSRLTNLENIYLPETITNIGSYAFGGCRNLVLTTLPDGITSIGERAFELCTNLVLESLPDGVTSIDSSAFNGCTSLALTTLPDGVTSIGSSAFRDCISLALISLPNGVTSIGQHAFNGCRALALTELPNGITNIDVYAFNGCSNLALTELPGGLTSIGDNVFRGCTKLALTELPSGITSIGNSAFSGCSNLNLTSLPSDLTNIGSSAFTGCSKLALTSLPNGVTSIGYGVFYSCTSLALTSLPNGVTSIGDSAFYGCSSITLSLLPNSLITIGKSAFEYCSNLALTSLPNSITSIGDWAFRACGSLALTSLPNGLTTIGERVFEYCDVVLTSIPIGVTSIGNYAFRFCNSLTLIELPNSVTSIGDSTFARCALKLIRIPSSVTNIGDSTFDKSNGLNYILCESDAVATLASGKGRADTCIYSLQEGGYDATNETEVVISDDVTIYTTTIDGYKWVRTIDNKYYKCIVNS